MRKSFHIGKVRFNFGWYHGEEFKLFSLTLLHIMEGHMPGSDTVGYLDLQVAKFIISIFA